MKHVFTKPNNLPALPAAALLLAAIFLWAAPAAAMQILDAADHAELAAEISDRAVSRITLAGDRVARVVRGPDGFMVEHDKARGDLYLRPLERASGTSAPLTLFIGTAKGFTYRLTLKTAARGSAQILIRNASAAPNEPEAGRLREGRVSAIVALVRAVARREVLPGYVIHTPSETPRPEGVSLLETWSGRRFTAHVYEADPESGDDPEVLVKSLSSGVAALWTAPPGNGPAGGRLVVTVRETGHRGRP